MKKKNALKEEEPENNKSMTTKAEEATNIDL